MKKLTAVVAVLVVALVVVSGVFIMGIVPLPKTGSTKTTYSPSSPQYNSPNVVSSNNLNTSLGGSWYQTTGTSVLASNSAQAMGIIESKSTSGLSVNYLKSFADPGNTILLSQMPFLSPPTYNSPSLSGITSLELAIFESKHGKGISSAGYIEEKNQTEVTNIWNTMNSSAKNSSQGNVSTGVAVYGSPYIYAYTKSYGGLFSGDLNSKSMYMNVIVSNYKTYLIMIFHFSTANVSGSNMTSLLNAELTILANPSSSPTHSIFLNSSQVKNSTGINEANYLQADINIQNASVLYNQFFNLTDSGLDPSELSVINDTLANITSVGVSVYGNGTGNVTLIGLASFSNSYNNTLFSMYLNYVHSESIVLHGKFNGSQYIYINQTSQVYFGSGYATDNSSILFFNYNGYLGVIYTSTLSGKLLSLSDMEVMLNGEITLL